MSPKQQQILKFVQIYTDEHGYAPTLAEIALGIGMSAKSKSFISRTLQVLAAQGHVTLKSGYKRNIELPVTTGSRLPILGRIAAGKPIEAIPQTDALSMLTEFEGSEHYVLQVSGDSMIEAGIVNGDFVIMRHRATAQNGEIVAVLIDQHEATLKYFHRIDDATIRLTPANSSLTPMDYAASRITIQGIYVGLLRIRK